MSFFRSLTRPANSFMRSATIGPNRTQGLSIYGYSRYYSTGANEPLFSYHIGASAAGKQTRLRPAEHGFNFWTQSFIQPETSVFSSIQKYSGEDAFFMAKVAKSNNDVILGVADGVGGWQDQGVNPGLFSHGLCRYMADAVARPEKITDLRPVNLLQKGYDKVQADKSIVAGGSTACIARAGPEGAMEVANLGDSGFAVLSPGKVSFMFEPQIHAFNTPYQLSKLTPEMQARQKRSQIFGGGAQIQESPSAADILHHQFRHGDVAVIGSDGLWDNLSASEVLKIVQGIMEKQGHWTNGSINGEGLRALQKVPADADKDLAGQLAYAIMREAKVLSKDQKRDGPFAKEVHKYFPGENYHGGKVDDICVIVAIAVQDAAAAFKPKAKL